MLLPLLTSYEKEHISERQPLPDRYLGLPDEEMDRRIAAAKVQLGPRVVILGHHYQRDEVIKFADYTGDSFKLARQVARHPDAEWIVFCGVHFMAESADVLRRERQQVVVPVTYINSAASIKAFCGEQGGVVCTSSNAAATLQWAWERGERILFLPDQHLG